MPETPYRYPEVRSNFDVFRDIVDYRIARKQEIFDWLAAQDKMRTDPQIIKQQWELLRAETERYTKMQQDLSDIHQKIIDSSDGVLKNIASGNASVLAARVRANTEEHKMQADVLLAAQDLANKADEAGRAGAAALTDKAISQASTIPNVQGAEADKFKSAVKSIWQTEYAGKFAGLQDEISRKRFMSNFYSDVDRMAQAASANSPGLPGQLASMQITPEMIARSISGQPKPTESEIQDAKARYVEDYQSKLKGGVLSAEVNAPTLAQRLGIQYTDEKGRLHDGDMQPVYRAAYINSLKLQNPELFNSSGQPKDEASKKIWEDRLASVKESDVKAYQASTPQDAIVFNLNDDYVNQAIEAKLLGPALEAKRNALEKPEPLKSQAEYEAEAVIEYNRMYGDRKQKELINTWESALGPSTNERPAFNNDKFQTLLSAAVERNAKGKPITSRFFERTLKQHEAEVKKEAAQETSAPIPPIAAGGIHHIVQPENPEANIEQAKGSGAPLKQMTPAPEDKAALVRKDIMQIYLDINADKSIPSEEKNVARRFVMMDANNIDIPVDATPEERRRAIAEEFYLFVSGDKKASASDKHAASAIMNRVLHTDSFTSKSSTIDSLDKGLQPFEGKKYSELPDIEKSRVDELANTVVRLHDEAVKQKPSQEIADKLQKLGAIADRIKNMDDVNNYEASHIKDAVSKGIETFKSSGHFQSPVEEQPIDKSSIKEKNQKNILTSVGQGNDIAQKAYDASIETDTAPKIEGELPSSNLNAIKQIASSPVKLYGKELDSALQKIAGSSWNTPSEQNKYRSLYSAYTILG